MFNNKNNDKNTSRLNKSMTTMHTSKQVNKPDDTSMSELGSARRPKLTDSECIRLLKLNGYFYYWKTGHHISDCLEVKEKEKNKLKTLDMKVTSIQATITEPVPVSLMNILMTKLFSLNCIWGIVNDVRIDVLIDCGSMNNFIAKHLVEKLYIQMYNSATHWEICLLNS